MDTLVKIYTFRSIILFFLLKSFLVNAQDASLRFKHLSFNEGLQNLTVYTLVQDYQGFLWIGTKDGLLKYDGYEFTGYYHDQDNAGSLKDNNINAIIEDDSRNLWIGTSTGLELYDRKNDSFIHIPIIDKNFNEQVNRNAYIKDYYVYYIHKDPENNVYIGTRHHVLYKVDKEKRCIMPFYSDLRFAENVVRSSDNQGNIWIASAEGAYRLNIHTKKLDHFTNEGPRSIASNQVFFIHVDKNSNVWIATDRGLNRIDGKTKKLKCYAHSKTATGCLPDYFVKYIYEDQLNNLWFCTENGLYKHNPNQDSFIAYLSEKNNENTLKTNRINCAVVDRQKILWIGTQTTGLDYAPLDNPHNFETIRTKAITENRFDDNPVTEIYRDRDDNLWIGTDGSGLHYIDFKTGVKRHYIKSDRHASSIQTNAVLAITQDRDGDLWFGGYYGGLNKFNKRTNSFETFSIEASSPDQVRTLVNEIKCIIEGDEKELIIATNGGGIVLFNKRNNTFRFVLHDPDNQNSLCSNWCINLMKDRDGAIWISTYYGLSKWDRKRNTFTNFLHVDTETGSLASNYVYSAFEDSRRNIWVATSKGLCKLNRKTGLFDCYSRKEGFPSESINDILEDKRGNLWVSTLQGLSKFNPETKEIITYNYSNGLQESQFNFGSCFKDRDGYLYFGSLEGFTRFNPEEIMSYSYNAPLYITEFQLLNKPVKVGDGTGILSNPVSEAGKVVLNYKQSFVTFKYAALNYLYPLQMQYSYNLEGFDEDWHNVGQNRTATYTNLSPGRYVFKVRASNKPGAWTSFSNGMEIVIRPPAWRTVWAYMFYLIVLSLIIAATIRFFRFKNNMKRQVEVARIKSEQQHKLDMYKLQFFTNISHELRTPLTLILGPTERLLHSIQDKMPADLSLADTIYRNSRRLLRLVNQLLDFRKLDSGNEQLNLAEEDIVPFIRNIFELFRAQAEAKKITYNFINTIQTVITRFDPDKIEKIFCNLLSNAIKFTSNNGTVSLFFDELKDGEELTGLQINHEVTCRFIKVTVSDTGTGIANNEKKKVFNSFYQSNNALFTKQEGSGIGLAIAKEYVLMHQGAIVVKDNVNNLNKVQGTNFIVYLPLERIDDKQMIQREEDTAKRTIAETYADKFFLNEPVEEKNADEPDSPDDTAQILVVEDNEDMRKFIKSELSAHFRIIEASNGQEGIDKTIRIIPDLIVSDIMMTDISGIELCKVIKTDIRTSHIPVILLTALFEDEYKIEGLETGADDFLVKPFNTEVLIARIRNLIDSRKQLQQKFQQSVGLSNKAAATNSRDQKFIEKLFAIIEKEMENPDIDVNMFTRDIGMSKTQLYKKIKAITGQSLFEFVYTIRLKKAAEILVHEDSTVTEVANRVGFSNLSVFTRSFTRQFKINPSKYASIYNPKK